MHTLFETENHRNIWLDDYGHGLAVQANQHMIVHNDHAILLDPGGHKAFKPTLAQVTGLVRMTQLKHIFLSHQDPDVVAAVNGWLLSSDAVAWCSALWVRFVPHFGLDKLVQDRLHPIPDEGMVLDLNGAPLKILPAHFLHSVGNFHLYDPTSKILYSGDLGASIGMAYDFVDDFEAHRQYMEPFHVRYMTCNRALRAWANMVSQLEIEMIVPQHGAVFRGTEMVQLFLDWCKDLECGIDVMEDIFRVPQ